MWPLIVRYFWLCLLIALVCCASSQVPSNNQMIKSTECKNVTVTKRNEFRSWEELYCLTNMERLEHLTGNVHLAYVGSNEKFHFFYWYTKRAYYSNQPSGFAVPLNEYVPKVKFDFSRAKIGEHPFE